MIIKVNTEIYVDVDDEEKAEEACADLDYGLTQNLRMFDFPAGEIITSRVNSYTEATEQEIQEYGLTE